LKGSRIGCQFSKFLGKTDISDAVLMCIANYYLQIMYPVQSIVVNIVLCLSRALLHKADSDTFVSGTLFLHSIQGAVTGILRK
jgi:hypothetical protein